MKGEILNLNGTALDGLVRVEDFGAKDGRHQFLVHVAHVTQSSTRWTPLPPKMADYTTEGPDDLLWPTWKIPVQRIDLATLATRAKGPIAMFFDDEEIETEGTHALWFKYSDRRSSSDPKRTSKPFTHATPAHMAWLILGNISWAKAAWERDDRRHAIRKITFVLLDVLAAHKKGQLIR